MARKTSFQIQHGCLDSTLYLRHRLQLVDFSIAQYCFARLIESFNLVSDQFADFSSMFLTR